MPWPLGAFKNRRSFLAIANLEFILTQMLEKTPPSGIYNVADDEALSTNDLVRTICLSLGKTARVFCVPAGFLRFAASAGTLLHLPFNKERLTKLTENYVVSNVKIKHALGVEKLPVSVRDGITTTIKYFSETR